MEFQFKNEWSNEDHKVAEVAILNFCFGRKTNDGRMICSSTFESLDNLLGFAYTSSGCYAGYFPCNHQLPFDKGWHIYGFGMTEQGDVVADVHNDEEGMNTFYFVLPKKQ